MTKQNLLTNGHNKICYFDPLIDQNNKICYFVILMDQNNKFCYFDVSKFVILMDHILMGGGVNRYAAMFPTTN